MKYLNIYARYLCILFGILLFANSQTWAQTLAPYAFTQTAGTYTPITGGMMLFDGFFDDDSSPAITIPAFAFGGSTQTEMYVSTNGFVTFGASIFEYQPLSSANTFAGAVAGFGGDLQSTTNGEIRWEQVGSEVVIQWANVRRYSFSPSDEIFSFQIRLNTLTNNIKFVYGGTITPTSAFAINPQIGLRGVDNSFPANVNNRTIAGADGNWINSTAGASNIATMYFNAANPLTVPSVGLTYTWTVPPACTGTPVAGNSVSSLASFCAGAPINLSLSGNVVASALAYQWQSFNGTVFVDIAGAVYSSLTSLPTSTTQYRCKVTCTVGNAFSYSTPVGITVSPATYATLPYTQGFETTWSSSCSTAPLGEAIPDASWRNMPNAGNTSWRADNTTTALSGWSSTFGSYTPTGAGGSMRSARFHTSDLSGSQQGSLDLYLNLSTAGNKLLAFDYRNESGGDFVNVLISTDNGATFNALTTAPAFLGATSTNWISVSATIVSTSPTAIIRFRATSNFFDGSDIGIDNVVVVPPCSGTPVAGSVSPANVSVCNPTTLSLLGATLAPSIAYQWESSTTSAVAGFAPIALATSATYTPAVPVVGTWYRCVVTCTNGNATATAVAGKLSPFTNISTYPYTENFDGITTTNNTSTQPIPDSGANPTNSSLPCGWAVLNNNLDNFTWKNANLTFNSSTPPNALAYNYNVDTTTPADDWVFSAPLMMTAGKAYVVSFKYGVSSSFFAEDIEVVWGASQNLGGMLPSNQIANIVAATNTSYQTQVCTAIVPTTTGVRYIGFHAKSPADKDNIYIDDIEVIETCPVATISPATLPNGSLGVAYNQAVSQSGFVTTVAWSISAGALPAGLALNTATGAITGTPTTTGTYSFTAKAMATGCSNELAYTGTIGCPATGTFSPATAAVLPQATVNVTYSTPITQTAFSGAATWVASGLPAGLSIDANTGVISGTATAITATPVSITVTVIAPAPNTSCSLSATYTLSVACASISVSPAALPNATINAVYPTQTLVQTGMIGGTITWALATGTLPTGLILNANTGAITGTPTVASSQTVTFTVSNGTCSQTTGNYTLTVDKLAQTINFPPITTKTYGDAPFALSATANSGLTVTYASNNLAVVTIAGNTVTMVGAGTAVITASQVGDNIYAPANEVPQTINVTKANQSIVFNALINKTYGDAPFDLTAAATSTLGVSYASNNIAVATISGSTVTIVGAGTAVITASQAGNGNYNNATDAPQTLLVNKANQTITFSSFAVKTFGDVPFSPGATASSGLAISYTSSTPTVATVTGSLLTIVGAGTSDIAASQAGNTNYNAATSVTRTLNIGKSNQTIIFPAITDKMVNGVPFALAATSSAGLTISYAISTVPATSVATLSGNTITIVGVGTVTVTASQAGNTNYIAASDVSRTFAINLPTNLLPAAIATEVVAYPNPSRSGLFQIKLGKLATNEVSYQVYDAAGKVLNEGIWKDQDLQTLDLTAMQNGTFTLYMQTSKGNVVRKLIKE